MRPAPDNAKWVRKSQFLDLEVWWRPPAPFQIFAAYGSSPINRIIFLVDLRPIMRSGVWSPAVWHLETGPMFTSFYNRALPCEPSKAIRLRANRSAARHIKTSWILLMITFVEFQIAHLRCQSFWPHSFQIRIVIFCVVQLSCCN